MATTLFPINCPRCQADQIPDAFTGFYKCGARVGCDGKFEKACPHQPLTPPAGMQWHNPDNLTAGQVGKDFRLYVTEELDGRHLDIARVWSKAQKTWYTGKTFSARESDCTYAVPIATPFPAPPKSPAPVPVSEPWIPAKGDWYQFWHNNKWTAPIKCDWPPSCAVEGRAYRSCSRPSEKAKEPWTLSSYLAKHWPDWGDRKAHRDDGWTQEMLAGGYRPCFIGEQGPYEFRSDNEWKKGSIESIPIPANKTAFARTKHPLPSLAETEPLRPASPEKPAPLPSVGFNADKELEESFAKQPLQIYHDCIFEEYRCPAQSPIKTQPETEPKPQNTTMNTSTNTPSIDLPPVGSRWVVQNAAEDCAWKVKVIAVGPEGVTYQWKKCFGLLSEFNVQPVSRWNNRTKAPIISRRQAKFGLANHEPTQPVLYRTRSSLWKGTRTRLFWYGIGVATSKLVWPMIGSGIAYVVQLTTQYLAR